MLKSKYEGLGKLASYTSRLSIIQATLTRTYLLFQKGHGCCQSTDHIKNKK